MEHFARIADVTVRVGRKSVDNAGGFVGSAFFLSFSRGRLGVCRRRRGKKQLDAGDLFQTILISLWNISLIMFGSYGGVGGFEIYQPQPHIHEFLDLSF